MSYSQTKINAIIYYNVDVTMHNSHVGNFLFKLIKIEWSGHNPVHNEKYINPLLLVILHCYTTS